MGEPLDPLRQFARAIDIQVIPDPRAAPAGIGGRSAHEYYGAVDRCRYIRSGQLSDSVCAGSACGRPAAEFWL